MSELRKEYVEIAHEFSAKEFDELEAKAKVAWEVEEDKKYYGDFEHYFELEFLAYPED